MRITLLTYLICFVLFVGFSVQPLDLNDNRSLYDLLIELGAEAPSHAESRSDESIVQKGYELVHEGKTTKPNGGKTTFISKHYVCTHCHNIDQEDPDLRFSNPDTRLTYAIENELPFLQGTTFKGMVNRETWYNDDYVKKYGDLAKEAHNSLEESVQLCAQECSQGRPVEDWEMEAILAYLWTLEYKIGDLGLSEEDMSKLQSTELKNVEKIALLKSYYSTKSPATFTDPPGDLSKGYGLLGDSQRGEALYKLSCQHCHSPDGVSMFVLDDSKLTFKKFINHMERWTNFNLYQITRRGTYPVLGHQPYMPHYTQERMSDQQIEDLRSYFVDQASR